MKKSRMMAFFVAGILVLLLFLAACISAQRASSAPANTSDALLQNASATTVSTVSANKNNSQKEPPSPELLKELRKFGLNYYEFGIHKWEFGPDTDEITLYAYSIHNQSQVDALQGTHIGNYTIRILHDTEFERTQHELVQNLTMLQQDSRYQIDHFYTPVDPFGDPPGRWIELWCWGYTPENKKLDNTLMMGWKIEVYPMAPLPTQPTTPTPSAGPIFTEPKRLVTDSNGKQILSKAQAWKYAEKYLDSHVGLRNILATEVTSYDSLKKKLFIKMDHRS